MRENCSIETLHFRYKDIWKSKTHGPDTSNEKAAQSMLDIDSNEMPATVHSRNLNQREVRRNVS